MDDDLSSLSAILMNDDYYDLLQAGRTLVDGVPVLSATHLILLKAKAWLDLTARKALGENVDSKHIRKHKNDVFRLLQLLPATMTVEVPASIQSDMAEFCTAMENEDVDTKALGLPMPKDLAIVQLRRIFI